MSHFDPMDNDRLEFDDSSSTSSEAVVLHEEAKEKTEAPFIDGQHIFEFEIDRLEDKPWLRPGADITDYFNYGFDEGTWRIYCARQREIREDYGTGFNFKKDKAEPKGRKKDEDKYHRGEGKDERRGDYRTEENERNKRRRDDGRKNDRYDDSRRNDRYDDNKRYDGDRKSTYRR